MLAQRVHPLVLVDVGRGSDLFVHWLAAPPHLTVRQNPSYAPTLPMERVGCEIFQGPILLPDAIAEVTAADFLRSKRKFFAHHPGFAGKPAPTEVPPQRRAALP
jgi:hypothetical protein